MCKNPIPLDSANEKFLIVFKTIGLDKISNKSFSKERIAEILEKILTFSLLISSQVIYT
jgi:hypothetical protein